MKLIKYRFSKKFIEFFLKKKNSNFLVIKSFNIIGLEEKFEKFYYFLKLNRMDFLTYQIHRYKTQRIRRYFPSSFFSIFVGKFYFIFFQNFLVLEFFFKFLKEDKAFLNFFFISFVFYNNRFFSYRKLENFFFNQKEKINHLSLLLFFFQNFFIFFLKLYKFFFIFQYQKLNFFFRNGNN